ncbi:thiamine ABC transporter substrate binding subunit [Halomicrobium sp. LC1Hm]|uniref:thiamine ABC transporter substrate-binding protein n=1 Tax=Halomicrobium sp. LC1Hm TaxID=2610902 RepID=UPI00129832A1|nr:thiamine ABC transporter substrate-binding protein [Halomicrobium sp. LC1Hm]QGA82311.1 ABC-type thiamine transport system, periplasmic component [Halomicrobium sp. LC1Hm]
MRRRNFLTRTGAGLAGLTALSGCTGDGGDGTESASTESATDTEATESATEAGTTTGSVEELSGTLSVATYSSFVGDGAAGNWLKSEFESEHPEVTVEFETPENGLNQYIQRKSEGAPIDADLFVGLNTGELVRADEQLDETLFATASDRIDGADTVRSELQFDPDGRVVPYDTGYISLVYDEGEVDAPGTFDALLEPAYEDALIAQNAQQSDPGRAFLLWTIYNKDPDGYLDYWVGLVDNGVTILSDWEQAYNAYSDEEAPMVVSYSTDQVFYHGEGVDMSRHQVGFLNDQGYANPEGMAQFVDSDDAELAQAFASFALTAPAQREIATRNVQFPAVEGVDPGGDFGEYALEPPEPVTFTYDELSGNVSGWIDEWARQIASN